MGKPLSYQTAGESHGPALVAIVDGLPADLAIGQNIKTGLFLICDRDSHRVLNSLLKIGGPSLSGLERALG